MYLNDFTQTELLVEEATNDDPCSPRANTMTRMAQASYDVDDYWRIADVLHRRLHTFDRKHWRQSYKSLILLDFLLTHGPEKFAKEFNWDIDVIRDLGSFQLKDEKGIDWGHNMQKRSDRILQLLQGGEILRKERLKALKITNEIKGFGNLMISPSSSPLSCGTSLESVSSLSSSSGTSSALSEIDDRSHDHNVDENGALLDIFEQENSEEEEKPTSFMSGICSKLGISPRGFGKKVLFTRVPNDADSSRIKKMQRQFSIP
ncbi:hypothetical protein ACH5RR_033000 [Cinchona calisaya]|uniref:ENTH domain-containing protein n=1 Tax=Cinchona calisaya TaxID=153742 RepID=A0ABD2YQ03_9GENT